MDVSQTRLENTNCKIHLLSRPDGSAYFSHGKTIIMAGVYGPVEPKMNRSLMDKASVEVYYRPKAGLPGVADRLTEFIVKNICETALIAALHPRSAIIVVLQEMQNNGGLLSSIVNAACLALMDSSIDMKFLVAGVGCVLGKDDSLCTHSGLLDYAHAKATFDFVFDSVEGRIVASQTTGSYTLETYEAALQKCKEESVHIFNYFRNVISNKHVSPS